ncbi:hypothetical protein [Devosia sp. MC1541]|uniref:hypothetical protein n=1 Tax=Devosia sp. MC1541 TaxID=2725264 RepID=UPI00145E03DA|nr:hypothetical protein [Devosia sp. MC1541]
MVEISDELRSKLILMFPKLEADAEGLGKSDASSGKRAQRKGLGQCEGGGERTGPTAARGGNASRMDRLNVTTTRKGTHLRIYRLVPLLAIVFESEGH